MAFTFREITYAPAVVAAITGISPDTQRDWRRAGYIASHDGWAAYTLHDLAGFYLVKLLVEAGFKPHQAWALADDEVKAAIVFNAATVPGAIIDKSKDKVLSARNIVKAAAELTGRRAWAAKIFAWGPQLEASAFASVEDARKAAAGNRDPQVVSFLDLEEVGTALAFQIERSSCVLAILDSFTRGRNYL